MERCADKGTENVMWLMYAAVQAAFVETSTKEMASNARFDENFERF